MKMGLGSSVHHKLVNPSSYGSFSIFLYAHKEEVHSDTEMMIKNFTALSINVPVTV